MWSDSAGGRRVGEQLEKLDQLAPLRYQHVVSSQDEAIASYLNELVEGTERARNADEERTRDPETRTDSGGDDGTRTHDPLLAKQVL